MTENILHHYLKHKLHESNAFSSIFNVLTQKPFEMRHRSV